MMVIRKVTKTPLALSRALKKDPIMRGILEQLLVGHAEAILTNAVSC